MEQDRPYYLATLRHQHNGKDWEHLTDLHPIACPVEAENLLQQGDLDGLIARCVSPFKEKSRMDEIYALRLFRLNANLSSVHLNTGRLFLGGEFPIQSVCQQSDFKAYLGHKSQFQESVLFMTKQGVYTRFFPGDVLMRQNRDGHYTPDHPRKPRVVSLSQIDMALLA